MPATLEAQSVLASPLKNPTALHRTSPESSLVTRIAESTSAKEAHRWFARERTWINAEHLALCRVPAPTFFENERAKWLRERFAAYGWAAHIDKAGNVLASSSGDAEASLVVTAHLDTVFAPSRAEEVYFAPDGRLRGPGVSDNGSGLVALLALARALSEISGFERLARSVLFAANVCEEGEGNLNGMRFLCKHPARLAGVKGLIVLDGPSCDHVTAQALASRRFEIVFQGPGGHSWNDWGTPNPVHALAQTMVSYSQSLEARVAERLADMPRFSYNFGIVEGGASINSIPVTARAKLDLRSEEAGLLDELAMLLSTAVERGLERENRAPRAVRTTTRLTGKIKDLGSRPGGRLPADAPLLRFIQAVDNHLNLRSRIDCASTDANVPLSLGLPAISIGAGGQGGGAHTPDEWYLPEGRELGLFRILLLLTALAGAEDSATE